MKLLIDKEQYKTKPDSSVAKKLTFTMWKNTVDISPRAFAVAVGRRGQTWLPSLLTNSRRCKANWKHQEIIALDFDNSANDLIAPDDAIEMAQKLGYEPFCCYSTFSSSPHHPKFRLVFMVEEPFVSYDEAKLVAKNLVDAFNTDAIDKGASSDPVRLFWGGKTLLWYNKSFLDPTCLKTKDNLSFQPTRKAEGVDLTALTYAEKKEFLGIIEAVERAIADPFNAKKTQNKLKKGNYYQTLGACVYFLMAKSPILLSFDDVSDIIVPVVDENKEVWHNVGDDWEEKFYSHYCWAEVNIL